MSSPWLSRTKADNCRDSQEWCAISASGTNADEKLRRTRARIRPIPQASTIAGIVSGEFDRIPEVNDAFLELVGYSREDLVAGRLHWPDLTPAGVLCAGRTGA